MEPEILYEDNHVIAVNKPAGLLTQPDKSGEISLLELLKLHVKKRDKKPGNVFMGMVHRLDRPVSGAILFAKTSKAASRLSEQIRLRRFGKLYAAVSDSTADAVAGYPEWTQLKNDLRRIGDITVCCQGTGNRTQVGMLQVKTLYLNGSKGVHLVRLETGRKHQIRAQLAHRGWPVCGDRKYGSQTGSSQNRGIGLHSCFIQIEHPVRVGRIEVAAALPEAMIQCFSADEIAGITSGLEHEIMVLKTEAIRGSAF